MLKYYLCDMGAMMGEVADGDIWFSPGAMRDLEGPRDGYVLINMCKKFIKIFIATHTE